MNPQPCSDIILFICSLSSVQVDSANVALQILTHGYATSTQANWESNWRLLVWFAKANGTNQDRSASGCHSGCRSRNTLTPWSGTPFWSNITGSCKRSWCIVLQNKLRLYNAMQGWKPHHWLWGNCSESVMWKWDSETFHHLTAGNFDWNATVSSSSSARFLFRWWWDGGIAIDTVVGTVNSVPSKPVFSAQGKQQGEQRTWEQPVQSRMTCFSNMTVGV